MNKQVSIVEAANGFIIQVVDPMMMAMGSPLMNSVARNVDEALYLVRQALTGVGERQPVPAIFQEVEFLEESVAKGAVGPSAGPPADLTFSTLLNGMKMLGALGVYAEAAEEECDDPTCECQVDEGGEDEESF